MMKSLAEPYLLDRSNWEPCHPGALWSTYSPQLPTRGYRAGTGRLDVAAGEGCADPGSGRGGRDAAVPSVGVGLARCRIGVRCGPGPGGG
jgi:hypothetical protein